MIIIIGDIGNTLTKICLVNFKSFKVKKIIYLDTSKIYSKSYLKSKLNNFINKQEVYKVSLFSSVVPKCENFCVVVVNAIFLCHCAHAHV